MKPNGIIIFFIGLLSVIFLSNGVFVNAQDSGDLIKTHSEATSNKIAPGEFLPISVKLVNFGSQKRVDVIVTYQILDNNGQQVFSEGETVAVDTTANFIKRIQLPKDIKPDTYTVQTSMKYPYQEAPAISKFQIEVERKFGKFFISDLIIYGLSILVIVVIAVILTYFLSRQKQDFNIDYHDYSDKPKDQMIYYEILSDIISEMRLRIGEDALKIAEDIPDLQIDNKTGLILNINNDPSKIIATIIARYEKLLGHKINISLRRT